MKSSLPDVPCSVQELIALCRRYPDQAHRWRPSPEACAVMGIDPRDLEPAKPWPESMRRDLIATCTDDAEFCAVLRMLLKGGEA